MNAGAAPVAAGFGERVLIALLLAVVGSIAYGSLAVLVPGVPTLVLLPTLLTTLYAGWLLFRSPVRTGRLVTSAAWLVSSLVMLLTSVPLPFHVLGLAAMVWLVRALYCYNRVLPAIADAGLVLFSLLAGFWAYTETGSPFLAFWSVFLVLSVFVRQPGLGVIVQLLPPRRRANSAGSSTDPVNRTTSRFDRARRDADLAVEKLTRA